MPIKLLQTLCQGMDAVCKPGCDGGDGATAYIPRDKAPHVAQGLLDNKWVLEDVTVAEFKEGYQAIQHFRHYTESGRITLRSFAPLDNAVFPTISKIYQGADWHERECMDFYPVTFAGHHNPTPLLLAADMADVYPLVKPEKKRAAYADLAAEFLAEGEADAIAALSSAPVGDPAGGAAAADAENPAVAAPLADDASAEEVLARTPIKETASPIPDEPIQPGARDEIMGDLEDGDFYARHFQETDRDDRLILNMGPQHPSTHGVLRIVLEMDGEYVLRAEPVLGYIHRMHDKMGETKTFSQFWPNTGRVDYLHALAWNHGYALAVEKLAGTEVPERAELIRILMVELNRISSHLLWWGAYLLDLGAFTPIMYAFHDRELLMDMMQRATGSRLTYAYFRFGGVSHDIDDKFLDELKEFIPYFEKRLPMFKALVTDNIILRKRVENVGPADADMCRRYGATGPVIRGAGVAYDVRRAEPYSLYPELEFDIPSFPETDAMARYMVRMVEMEESLRIVKQCVERLPSAEGGHVVEKAKLDPKVPAGESYAAVEGARGEIGFYLAADGGKTPYRLKLRAPSFSNLNMFAECAEGCLLADAVSILGSLDLVIPEIDR